jgi:hypothetical protein
MTSSPIRVILASLLVGIASTISFASEKLNILLLLSDDHSYPFLSCYGDTNVKTPTIDRLAQEGIRFHRYFTTCPQCVPSRASLMTGRSPVAARMTRFSSPLPRDEMTLPELLKSKGNYYTGGLRQVVPFGWFFERSCCRGSDGKAWYENLSREGRFSPKFWGQTGC